MAQMKFSTLSLLSQKERRGLQIDFSAPATVLVAGAGFGKSAILKSLYEGTGCQATQDPDYPATSRVAAIAL